MWLAILDKLTTKYKVLCWGYSINPTCIFYNLACETVEHLFFECSFTRRIWRQGLEKCQVNTNILQLGNIITYITPLQLDKNLKAFTLKHLLAASTYFIWLERNRRIFCNLAKTEESIFLEIARHVKFKVSFCNRKFACNTLNKEICKAWEIEDIIV